MSEISFSATNTTLQFLTFALDGEEYGIDILKVQEIKGYVPTTSLPNSPSFVTGVLNLRGTIVPLVDLRCKFGLKHVDFGQYNAIVVVNVGDRVMGLVVDSVSEVVLIDSSEIEPAPVVGFQSQNVVAGMAKHADRLIILLDVEEVLNFEDTTLTLAA